MRPKNRVKYCRPKYFVANESIEIKLGTVDGLVTVMITNFANEKVHFMEQFTMDMDTVEMLRDLLSQFVETKHYYG
jgi:hypothetical protein